MHNPSHSSPPQTPGILIVDDSPANLQLLVSMLKERGYKTRPAANGQLALAAARHTPPDLVLLDINMPEMNGYEVCRQFKADPHLADIPILFISAMNETDDKVAAFREGGVDYVTKPFKFEEVEARVHAHLEIRRQRQALQEAYSRVAQLERLRDDLTHMMIHDMRTPLFTLQMILESADETAVDQDAERAEMVVMAQKNVARLTSMVNQMLDISRMQAGQMPLARTEADLGATVRQAADSLAMTTKGKRLVIAAHDPLPVSHDTEIIQRVVTNLINNALKFTAPDGEVRLHVFRQSDTAGVRVQDFGPGIAPESQKKIFEKFGQIDRNKQGFGLGLTFCKLAIEVHGGEMGVESEPGHGSTFFFTLPLTKKTVAQPAPASALSFHPLES